MPGWGQMLNAKEDRMCGGPLTWKKGCDWRLSVLLDRAHGRADYLKHGIRLR